MTLTTTPNHLTDGLEKVLAPLKKIHIPVHEIAMTMSIALRHILYFNGRNRQDYESADGKRCRFRVRKCDPESEKPGAPSGAPVYFGISQSQ